MDAFRHRGKADSLHIGDAPIGGSGPERYETLRLHEHSLQKRIKAAIEAKSEEVSQKQRNENAVKTCLIGVIGYTNSGKTTLIKKYAHIFIIFDRHIYFFLRFNI
jgi:50S ribosomal subunit-associated GTPase HflX